MGAGGWGTALALTLAARHDPIRLWVFESDLARTIRHERVNPLYLPDVTIPADIHASSSMEEVLSGAEIVISAVPSHVFRQVFTAMLPHLRGNMTFVTATKGIENRTMMRMSEVIHDVVRETFTPRIAAISGPTFAVEVARQLPTALVVASPDEDLRRRLQKELSTPRFRLYTNPDIVGVEIGGAVKNIIAIAAGVVAGMQLGHNATAALITRGLAEIMRLAEACGGNRRTLAGLAGLGDLVLTCHGHLSRNRQVGVALGQGKRLSEIVSGMRMVAEGVRTSESTVTLARQLGVEMPIAEEVYSILYRDKDAGDAINALMDRELTEE